MITAQIRAVNIARTISGGIISYVEHLQSPARSVTVFCEGDPSEG